MKTSNPLRIGYVVKRYPRFSETFIVNELLAHEAAGWPIEIFSLGPCIDSHFQNIVSCVRGAVTYLPSEVPKASEFWRLVEEAADQFPGFWGTFEAARGENVRDVYQALCLVAEIKKRGIDHLHAHFATSATSVARLASLFSQVPFSFTAHAKDIFHESVVPEDLERKLTSADSVVTVSDFNLEFLQNHYGAAAGKVVRLYNGLHLDRFAYSAPEDRPPVVIAVGRLVEKEGFSDLLKACAILRDSGTSFRCQIVGNGDQEDALRSELTRLGLGSLVELSGARPQSDIIRMVQSAAVMAAPCIVGEDGNRDGMPTVLLEAMALGTPCVSTPVTGIPEIVREGETGLLIPQRDPVALALALKRLLGDARLRIQLASRARRLIEAEFDIVQNAQRQRELFNACARERSQTQTGQPALCS